MKLKVLIFSYVIFSFSEIFASNLNNYVSSFQEYLVILGNFYVDVSEGIDL